MRSSRKLTAVVLSVAMAVCSLLPCAAMGQTTTSQPSSSHGVTIHTQLPRNNVVGGTIANGRPGLLVQSAIATHITRQASALHAFGGATMPPTFKPPTSIRNQVLPQLVQIFLGALQAVTAALNAAISALPTTGT